MKTLTVAVETTVTLTMPLEHAKALRELLGMQPSGGFLDQVYGVLEDAMGDL